MQAHTKKPLIEAQAVALLTFTGPAAKVAAAMSAMRELGFTVHGKARPWREAFPHSDEEMPGVFLAGARYREGMTQAQLAEATGIPRRHISEMEHGKRPMGKQTARKLAEALKVDPRRFLSM